VALLTTGHGIAASLNCARFNLCEAATFDDAVDLQSYGHVRNVGLAQRRREVKANAKLFLDWIERINGAALDAALTPGHHSGGFSSQRNAFSGVGKRWRAVTVCLLSGVLLINNQQ